MDKAIEIESRKRAQSLLFHLKICKILPIWIIIVLDVFKGGKNIVTTSSMFVQKSCFGNFVRTD